MKHEVKCTTNYSMFKPHAINRDTMQNGIPKDRDLLDSMRKDGFRPYQPLVVYRDPVSQKYVIAYGHNRFSTAKYLGIPLWYQEVDGPIDPRKDKSRPWQTADHIVAEVKNGNENYLILDRAIKRLGVTSARAGVASILSGDISRTSAKALREGTFVVHPEGSEIFEGVLTVTDAIQKIGGRVRYPFMFEHKVLATLALLYEVPGFDMARLALGVMEHGDRISKQASRMGYIEMFDGIYNYRKSAQYRFDVVGEARKTAHTFMGNTTAAKWLKS